MLQRRPGMARVVDPVHDRPVATTGQLADLRVVAVDDEDRLDGSGRRSPPAPRRCAPARRSGRAGRGRDCRAARRAAARGGRPPEGAFVDLEQPEVGVRCASRVEATPETRFAPERFQASRRNGARISAAIAVVVVLPFVAETTAAPSRSARRARRSPLDRASRAACRAASCRRPCRRCGRAWTAARAASDSTARRALMARAYPHAPAANALGRIPRSGNFRGRALKGEE